MEAEELKKIDNYSFGKCLFYIEVYFIMHENEQLAALGPTPILVMDISRMS